MHGQASAVPLPPRRYVLPLGQGAWAVQQADAAQTSKFSNALRRPLPMRRLTQTVLRQQCPPCPPAPPPPPPPPPCHVPPLNISFEYDDFPYIRHRFMIDPSYTFNESVGYSAID